MIPEVDLPDSFSWYNSGVLGFTQTDQVQKVLTEWEEIFCSHRKVNSEILNQGALRAELYQNDIKIGTLPFEYNYHVLYPQRVADEVKLLHGHINNFEKVAQALNREPETRRFFNAIEGGGNAHLSSTSLWEIRAHRVLFSIEQRGVTSTLRGLSRMLLGGDFSSE